MNLPPNMFIPLETNWSHMLNLNSIQVAACTVYEMEEGTRIQAFGFNFRF